MASRGKNVLLLTSFSLPFSELSLVGLAFDVVDVTIVFQCYDTVGWLGHVTRKTVSEMTYNISSGTLNSTITV